MKRFILFFLVTMAAMSEVSESKAAVRLTPYDLSNYLVTAIRRDATIYQPAVNTNVRTKGWSDNSSYIMARNSSTDIPSFFYSPYQMCDGKVFKVMGYYTENGVKYAILQVTISGTDYSIFWPLYLNTSSGGITSYENFLQPA